MKTITVRLEMHDDLDPDEVLKVIWGSLHDTDVELQDQLSYTVVGRS